MKQYSFLIALLALACHSLGAMAFVGNNLSTRSLIPSNSRLGIGTYCAKFAWRYCYCSIATSKMFRFVSFSWNFFFRQIWQQLSRRFVLLFPPKRPSSEKNQSSEIRQCCRRTDGGAGNNSREGRKGIQRISWQSQQLCLKQSTSFNRIIPTSSTYVVVVQIDTR